MADIRIERTCKLKEQKPNPDRRERIGGLLTQFAKFAIDSTINIPLKAFTGRKQAYEIVQEGLKDRAVSISLDDKKPEDLKLVREEMQAKMEKMQEDMKIVKQQHKISTKHVEESEHLKKKPDEVGVQQNNRKKIFIRSRL